MAEWRDSRMYSIGSITVAPLGRQTDGQQASKQEGGQTDKWTEYV